MTKEWVKAALMRALKTFAQAMVAQIGAGSIGIVTFDWKGALSVAAMAAVLSIFTSLAGLPEVEQNQPTEMTDKEARKAIAEGYEGQEEFEETEGKDDE